MNFINSCYVTVPLYLVIKLHDIMKITASVSFPLCQLTFLLVSPQFFIFIHSSEFTGNLIIDLKNFSCSIFFLPNICALQVNHQNMSLTQETLWNTAMMLLSPQQRLVPYHVDMWTRLWDQLAKRTGKEQKPRFRPSLVADKLMISLVCYQVLCQQQITLITLLLLCYHKFKHAFVNFFSL